MRLLNSTTYELSYFMAERDLPPYAILSHTWEGGEVSLQDLQSPLIDEKSMGGWYKIQKCCKQAVEDGYDWVWIDSCCIDKTSSAELSEAINSMFRWYTKAHVCYAYLADVPSVGAGMDSPMMQSRWFTRGWTLQELIAPANVEFYDQDWNEIGTKRSLVTKLSTTTTIPKKVLLGQESPLACLAGERFSWSSRRQTSRLEDTAYCLLGLFDIHMPLLYGEGRKAFERLQEQILKSTGDMSLLLWSGVVDDPEILGETQEDVFLCVSPANFRPIRYKTLGDPDDRVFEANWSLIASLPHYDYMSRSADSVVFTPSGLQVKLHEFDSQGTCDLIWTYQALYTNDHSQIRGILCIEIGPPKYEDNTRGRTCPHLWLVTVDQLNWETNLVACQVSLRIKLPTFLTISPWSTRATYQRIIRSDHSSAEVKLKYLTNSEQGWLVEEDLSSSGTTSVRLSSQETIVQIPRRFKSDFHFYSLQFIADLRLRINMLADSTKMDVMLLVYLDLQSVLCSLRNWVYDKELQLDSQEVTLLIKEMSDRDELHIPGTDYIVRVAVKLKSGTVEYQISIHRKVLGPARFVELDWSV